MFNPFERRATEYLRDDEAFLAVDKLGVSYDNVYLTPDVGSPGARSAAGAESFESLVKTAARIEEGVLRVIGALVPPPASELAALDADYYRPFETLEDIQISFEAQQTWFLHPLVICDDANTLHPFQLAYLQRWLIRRELRVGRWLLTRLDALRPEEAFAIVHQEERSSELPGVTISREIIQINLQSERKDQKVQFRRMARDMANRYMRQMPTLSSESVCSRINFRSARSDLVSLATGALKCAPRNSPSFSHTRRSSEYSVFEPESNALKDLAS